MANVKKVVKRKKEKTKLVRFYGINITLQSKERKGPSAYLDLVKKIHEEQMYFTVGHEIMMLLRTLFSTNLSFKGKDYPIIYGKILRFNTIKNWYNQKEQIFQDYKLPEDLVPNAFETDYIFIPEVHKFFIRYNNRVNIYQALSFMGKALGSLLVTGEKINLSIITSSDTIERILSAKVIKSLDIDVSYTNDDIGNEAEELIDQMLKEANSGKASVVLKPDSSGSLNPQSDLVKGFVGVAKDNGTVTARIVNSEGKSETIRTENYPEKFNLQVTETDEKKEDEKEVLFNRVMTDYRDRNSSSKQTLKKKNVGKRKRK